MDPLSAPGAEPTMAELDWARSVLSTPDVIRALDIVRRAEAADAFETPTLKD